MNELTIRMSIETTTDGFDAGVAPIGDKALSLEVCRKYSVDLRADRLCRTVKRNGKT